MFIDKEYWARMKKVNTKVTKKILWVVVIILHRIYAKVTYFKNELTLRRP